MFVDPQNAHMWRLKDNLWKSVLSLRQIGPRVQTKIVRLGSRCLHLIHLPDFHSFLKSGIFSIYTASQFTILLMASGLFLVFPLGNNDIEKARMSLCVPTCVGESCHSCLSILVLLTVWAG